MQQFHQMLEACANLACDRALGGRWISISELSGTTRGRKERECGAMGVSRVPGTEGATMGPPADMLYAVEPEGVAMIRPSAYNNNNNKYFTGVPMN